MGQGEAKVALLFLTLQREDDTREKGLTRLAFEALVRGVLRGTSSEHRMARSDVQKAVRALLISHDENFVLRQVDSTLLKLTKRSIRHHVKDDTFCLTHEETLRVNDHLTQIEARDKSFQEEVGLAIAHVLPAGSNLKSTDLSQCIEICRAVIENFLYGRGEQFATAVSAGTLTALSSTGLRDVAEAEVKSRALTFGKQTDLITIVEAASNRVLVSSSEIVRHYVRSLSDGYTLFAFLQQTPDVQEAVRKIFTRAEVWVDTGVILRLFAESLLEPEAREFQKVFQLSSEVGIKFRVISGVIEETERHMNRSLACANTAGGWKGRVPFLLAEYANNGYARSGFASWLDTLRGAARPEDDIAEYLKDTHQIARQDLSEELAKASAELRSAVNEIWTSIHAERRKKAGYEIDSMLIARLALHDSENYVGVIEKRQREVDSPFGFTSWWLTLDHMAFGLNAKLSQWLKSKPPHAPVMSMDFLSNYLVFGPIRGRLSKEAELSIPAGIHNFSLQHVTPELLQLAEQTRLQHEGLPERVVRRKVRDALDAAKRRVGPMTLGDAGDPRQDV